MPDSPQFVPEWVTRGKSIRQLISELQTFEDQDSEVRISLDSGVTHHTISLVGRYGSICVLLNAEADYAAKASETGEPAGKTPPAK